MVDRVGLWFVVVKTILRSVEGEEEGRPEDPSPRWHFKPCLCPKPADGRARRGGGESERSLHFIYFQSVFDTQVQSADVGTRINLSTFWCFLMMLLHSVKCWRRHKSINQPFGRVSCFEYYEIKARFGPSRLPCPIRHTICIPLGIERLLKGVHFTRIFLLYFTCFFPKYTFLHIQYAKKTCTIHIIPIRPCAACSTVIAPP